MLVIGALLLICLASSTRDDRAAARQWLAPIARWLIVPLIVLWGLILWPLIERAG